MMPPKAKFTKEEIVDAAFEIVCKEGLSGLTARALGAKLGSSARPIFTVFQNMEELQQTVIQTAKKRYAQYVEKGLLEETPFKGVGLQYILFAVKEPKLFQLLFMAEQKSVPDLSDVLPLLDDSYEKILLANQQDYGIGRAAAQSLYRHLWIYTHGIAVLCATNTCRFTGAEIEKMLAEVSAGLLIKMKAGQ